MFDIAPSELLVVVLVAIVVIGPKDLPIALRTAGRWIGKMRRMSAHFRSGVEAMIREAELEEMEKKWREQNAAIMAQTATTTTTTGAVTPTVEPAAAPAELTPHPAASAEFGALNAEQAEQFHAHMPAVAPPASMPATTPEHPPTSVAKAEATP